MIPGELPTLPIGALGPGTGSSPIATGALGFAGFLMTGLMVRGTTLGSGATATTALASGAGTAMGIGFSLVGNRNPPPGWANRDGATGIGIELEEGAVATAEPPDAGRRVGSGRLERAGTELDKATFGSAGRDEREATGATAMGATGFA